MTVVMSSIGNGDEFFNANGTLPNTGGFLGVYAAGTSNLVTIYTDYTGGTPQTNPIPLNPDGRCPYELWWTAGALYKVVLLDVNSAIIRTYDNIPGINDPILIGVNATNLLGGAAGSIPYQSAANTTAMLAIGAANTILSIASGLPAWQYPLIPVTQTLSAVTTGAPALTDIGGAILITDTSFTTLTIPANSSVAFPVGSSVTVINAQNTTAISIAITTDTMTLINAGSTGTRTLAKWGMATLVKVTSTSWVINGTGLT